MGVGFGGGWDSRERRRQCAAGPNLREQRPGDRRQAPERDKEAAAARGEYRRLDDLLGSYVRLKGLGILPAYALDEGFQAAFYYEDPDRNIVELNMNYYGDQGNRLKIRVTNGRRAEFVVIL